MKTNINIKLCAAVGMLFLLAMKVNAATLCCDYSDKCAPSAYGISSKTAQVASKITGATFLSEKFAQAIIRNELKKATKEKFKVEMKTYSVKDLAQGKFKSLKITGKNLEIEGVYITKFEAKTLCPFNYVELDKNNIKFKENLVMGYSLEISDSDLRRTMQSSGYLEALNKINLSAMGITFFKLSGADVMVKNNKLNFAINVKTPLSSNHSTIIVRSDVKVENGNIVMTKAEIPNIYTFIDLSRVTYLLNALNPLTFSTDILNNKNTKMKVTDVSIIGDKIYIKGAVFIHKNTIK